jgi:hypothetical protein
MPTPPPEARATRGNWSLLYVACCALAVLVMTLLYWFTAHFNVRVGA